MKNSAFCNTVDVVLRLCLLYFLRRLSDLNFGLQGLMWVAPSLPCQPLQDWSQMDLTQLSHTLTPAR